MAVPRYYRCTMRSDLAVSRALAQCAKSDGLMPVASRLGGGTGAPCRAWQTSLIWTTAAEWGRGCAPGTGNCRVRCGSCCTVLTAWDGGFLDIRSGRSAWTRDQPSVFSVEGPRFSPPPADTNVDDNGRQRRGPMVGCCRLNTTSADPAAVFRLLTTYLCPAGHAYHSCS